MLVRCGFTYAEVSECSGRFVSHECAGTDVFLRRQRRYTSACLILLLTLYGISILQMRGPWPWHEKTPNTQTGMLGSPLVEFLSSRKLNVVILNLQLFSISYLIHIVVTLNYGWELYIFKVSQNSFCCYTVG